MFRLAYRQAEGLIGSIIALLGLALCVPDHTTLSRRSATLEVSRRQRPSTGAGGGEAAPMHLLVDSTGLKLCGAGEWLLEKHGTHARRSWKKPHLGVDADTGRILASALTDWDIAEHGRMGWQKASGYTARARAEAAIGRWKQVIGDRLRAHTDERRVTEVEVAVHALNRMLELGRPIYARMV